MNDDKIKGQWKQLSGKFKAQWGKLTNDDLQVADGNVEYLAGRLQERYGIACDEAEKQIEEFELWTESCVHESTLTRWLPRDAKDAPQRLPPPQQFDPSDDEELSARKAPTRKRQADDIRQPQP